METYVNPRTAFTINRVVEIRKAKIGNPNDDKFLIFFERDEDWEPKIDIYSEDHDTISAINKKLKESGATKRYYLVVDTCGNVAEPHCKNGFFTANGYIKDNGDIVITSYEEVNHKEEKDMRRNDITVEDVYNSMTDRQQKYCQFIVDEAIKNVTRSFAPDSIKKVIYNDPATIIFWSDGTKTIVKCMEDEDYDPEKGFMAAVTKKAFGDKYGWVMRHQVKPAAENENKVSALMGSIADALRRRRTAQESAMAIRDQMLISGATHWELETFDRFVRKYISDKEEKMMADLMKVEPQVYNSCVNCICSVCHIAESNGGAPGCGNCEGCKGENPVHDCGEFYASWRYLRYCKREDKDND